MIIKTKLLQDSCKKILDAVDSGNILNKVVSETVELETVGQTLLLNVTNREYYVSVKIPLDSDAEIHAVVDAKLFLNLISRLSTNDVELNTSDAALIIKANGNYKIPLIYDEEGKLLALPKIDIENVTNEFTISNSVLQSVLRYNSKELLKSSCVRPVQRLFYIDEKGALTFTSGACVNEFSLAQPVTLFLTEKIIKLFKLLKGDISFSIGQDECNGKIITKVSFDDGTTSIVSLLGIDQSVTSTFPVKAIRNLADASYEYSVDIDKRLLLDAVSRLSLFASSINEPMTFVSFGANALTVYDSRKDNEETIEYSGSDISMDEPYLAQFMTNDLRLTLESCEETHISLKFGNHRNIVIARGNVKNILPECRQ